ncbi:hypothetical protein [Mycobacterium sp. PSTR-4-N]|uniref:hypothetical protein n=1 Tax=Mycobacterium sp. PSTR-4-N TaxID=2917745 RepID=UPI001F154DEB|nr:hypothetical protein [Mycobacterium sp. PSTR-4-N]MCG7596370.1 hypothetical protein [Mycobacterium sp. PSTR-4-N]
MGVGPSVGLVNSWLTSTFVLPGAWLDLHLEDPGSGGTANQADIDARQLGLFVISADGKVTTTGAPPQFIIGTDGRIKFGSLHTALEGGTWLWNLTARSPIDVVAGDVLIIGDGIELSIEGWTA